MKKCLLLSILFLFPFNLSTFYFFENVSQWVTACVKNHFPSLYIQLNKRNIYRDICIAAKEGNNNFLHSAFAFRKRKLISFSLNDIDEKFQKTPLQAAVEANQYTTISLLLQEGADVDKSNGNYTPVQIALFQGHICAAGLLLENLPFLEAQASIAPILSTHYNDLERPAVIQYIAKLYLSKQKDISSLVKYVCRKKEQEYPKDWAKSDLRIAKSILQEAIRQKDSSLIDQLIEINHKPILQLLAHHTEPLHKALKDHYKKYSDLQKQIEPIKNNEIKTYKDINFFAHEIFMRCNSIEKIEWYSEHTYLNPLKLQIVFEYAERLIKKEVDYVDKSCSICFEGLDTKKWITPCANDHGICLSCFNNPSLKACPLCRGKFRFTRRWYESLQRCQRCGEEKKRVKFWGCPSCKQVGIIGDECVALPCCNQNIPLVNEGYEVKETKEEYSNSLKEEYAFLVEEMKNKLKQEGENLEREYARQTFNVQRTSPNNMRKEYEKKWKMILHEYEKEGNILKNDYRACFNRLEAM